MHYQEFLLRSSGTTQPIFFDLKDIEKYIKFVYLSFKNQDHRIKGDQNISMVT